MSDSSFFDTNIILYATLQPANEMETRKKQIARKLLNEASSQIIISSQVIVESVNVLIKKSSYSTDEIIKFTNNLLDNTQIVLVDMGTVLSAVEICDRYKFSFYDALIISSALTASCEYLITEDMQDQQIIHHNDRQVKLINPFKELLQSY